MNNAKRKPILAFALFLLLLLLQLPSKAGYAQQGYSNESLFVALFSNGDALIEYDIKATDPDAVDTRVNLFGQTTTDLIVTDYEDNLIEFEPGNTPNEIVISGVSNGTGIRINYDTSDLVDKHDRIWTFSIDSPTITSVKLPEDSFVIDYGEHFTGTMVVGKQQILTFDPGRIQINYIIGFLGTEDRANTAIKVAEITIREIQTDHPGIILNGAQDFLKKANEARDGQRYADAEKLAVQANDLATTTEKDYAASQSAITSAEENIQTARENSRDVSKAEPLFLQAKSQFAQGNYTNAKTSATDAISSIGQKIDNSSLIITVAGIVVAGGAGASGAIFIFKRKKDKAVQQKYRILELGEDDTGKERDSSHPHLPYSINNKNDNNPAQDNSVVKPFQQHNSESIHNSIAAIEKEKVIPSEPTIDSRSNGIGDASLAKPTGQSPAATPLQPIVPESQTDRSLLSRIVQKILAEKPNLRPEDQEVLRFLAENEGAAFESELRNKFQLPKTTIWRLVKRLEREELIEVRKAGGQNLIKLRFEGK